ncbi:MAG: 50S ribosomal protein L21 [Alphaproteobacteria bacterium]|nr:50S ribosomal protein L21 [Alphaproteobacteria bacterium]
MIAIVKIAGQQFKVTEGTQLYVPHLNTEQQEIELSDVLLLDHNGTLTVNPKSCIIKAEVLAESVQAEKVIAFKMKRRKGFRKKHGHRTVFTKIKIIGLA